MSTQPNRLSQLCNALQYLFTTYHLTNMKNLLFYFLLLLSLATQAQHTVTGTVKDESGIPLPGATILIKGTTTGTVANFDGRYSIKVPNQESILIFNFVGFESQEITVKDQSVIDVKLKVAGELDEVVVTSLGYSSSRRSKPKRKKHHSKAKYAPLPTPVESSESYDLINENTFSATATKPLSTFSIDVDVASYSNVRRFIETGQAPPKDAVRIEEMLNYFDYTYAQPKGKDPFNLEAEVASCPWNTKHKLVHIGLQGLEVDQSNLPPSNLVFLLDVSGSMSSSIKLPCTESAGIYFIATESRPQHYSNIKLESSEESLR